MTAKLEDLIKVRSQLADGLLAYFQLVQDAPDRPAMLPAYLGERTRSALYVEPDVLKRERRVEPLVSEARAPERELRLLTQFAAEAQDIGEEAIYGERERETERRVAWAVERKELARVYASRAVILAPPGQGKSLLTQMTANGLARDAQGDLSAQRVSPDNVVLPIVVTLNALTNVPLRPGDSPEETLRRALATALRGDDAGYPEIAVNYLAAHAHENRCWLFLDALDEAGDEQALTKLFTALKDWRCRLIITSRPYGYAGRRLPFDVTEYRLAPVSDEQARLFVSKWFAGRAGQARMNDLLARSLSVQQMSQNPFLLTLLCWVAERRELATNITRTQIYDRVTRDLLGLPANGVGGMDDQRAGEWLPLLTEIAFTFFQEHAGRRPLLSDQLLDLIENSPKRPAPLGLTPLQTANLTPRQQATYLLDELRQKRLLVPLTRDRAAYVAPHRSFLEYFTACALAKRAKQDGWQAIADLVDSKAWLPEWEETLILLAGQLADPIPFLELLMDAERDDYFRHRLCLAARCLPELSTQGRQEVSQVSQENNENLQQITAQIAGKVFHLWGDYQERGWKFPHIKRNLPYIAQVSPTTLLPPLLSSLHDVRCWVCDSAAETLGQMGAAAAQPDVLRALVNVALHNPQEVVHGRAAGVLEQMGAAAAQPEIITALVTALHDVEDRVRGRATKVLGCMGSAAATEPVLTALVTALHDAKGEVRESAAEALGQMGAAAAQPDVLRALVNVALHDAEDRVRSRAAEALGQMGARAAQPDVLRALVNVALYDRENGVRSRAAEALGCMGSAAATEPVLTALVTALHDAKGEVRESAAEALGRMGAAAAQPDVLRAFVAALHDAKGRVRNRAAEALGRMGTAAAQPSVLTVLVTALHDRENWVRSRAAEALGCMGSATATEPVLTALVTALHDAKGEVRESAAEALGQMGAAAAQPGVLRALVTALHDTEYWVRRSAAAALGRMRAAAAQPDVLRALVNVALYDARDRIRSRAVEALGQMGTAAAQPDVLQALVDVALHDIEDDVCNSAAAALGRMGMAAAQPDVLQALITALHGARGGVQESAAKALGRIGAAAAQPDVLRALIEAVLDDARDRVRSSAAGALGRMGAAAAQPDVLQALVTALHDAEYWVRSKAAEALGQMFDQGVRISQQPTGQWKVKTVAR